MHHDHEQQPALQLLGSQPVNMHILFLAVPPRSNQRVQQQHLSSASRAWDLLFNFSSLAAFFPIFFPVTPKISENRIHAHIKDDWEFLLPSGTSCKKPGLCLHWNHYTNTDKPAGQRHCSEGKPQPAERESSRQLPWPVKDAFVHPSRTHEENPHKKPIVWSAVRRTIVLSDGRKEAH